MNAHQRRKAARQFERRYNLKAVPLADLTAVVRGQTTHVRLTGPLQDWSRSAGCRYAGYGYYAYLDDEGYPMPEAFEPGARNYYLWRRQREEQA